MSATEKDLFEVFEKLGISYRLYRHEPFFTVEESRKLRRDWPGGHCKCLFIKDKKDNLVLVVARENLKVDLKKLSKTLGLGRFSFCDEKRLLKFLGVSPGAVTPFAVINAPSPEAGESFRVVVDAGLQKFDIVNFHPLHNQATVGISFADLIRFMEYYGIRPQIMDLV